MPKITKVILSPGRFLVNDMLGGRREETFTAARIREYVEKFKRMLGMGLLIPTPWKHDKSGPVKPADITPDDSRNNAGFWEDMWINEKGELVGRADIPLEEDFKRVGTTVKEVSPLMKDYTAGDGTVIKDCITHVALVTHPVQGGQATDSPFTKTPDELTIAMSCFVAALADDQTIRDQSIKQPSTTTHASNATIQEAVAMLATVGIVLPEDTTEENLVERLVVACKALKGKEQQTNGQGQGTEPKSGVDQPTPIAMSVGLSTMADDKRVAKAIELATSSVRASYINRVKALVTSGRISGAYAKEHLEPHFTTFALSIDAEGTVQPHAIDGILKALEALPGFVAASQTSSAPLAKSQQAGGSNIFGLAITDEPLPEGALGAVALEGEDLDKSVNNQLEAAGYVISK